MTPRQLRRSLASVLLLLCLAWTAQGSATPITFTDTGATPADIQGGVNAFRAALGDPNNGNNPGANGGRREINWDGGGSTANAPGGTPFNVFLNTRGGQFITGGTGFVQAPASGGANGGLEAIFPGTTYGTTFSFFSPTRLFVPVGSNALDALFFVPGTNGLTPASVSGFGAVFTDVDLANVSHMDFFDSDGGSLGSFFVPPGGTEDGSLSFLGVVFSTERIARVHIVLGNTPLAADVNDNPQGGVDLVALDDFLFAEPRAIPAPSGLTLLGLGLAGALAQRRLRKRKA